MRSTCAAAVLVTVLATTALAQQAWTRLHVPDARSVTALAYDAGRNRAVLFGGTTGSRPSGTWVWDGTGWSEREPRHSPSPREGHAMAYDAARDQVVLFGGYDGFQNHADTWVWDGDDWTQLFPANSPPARRVHGMAYDSARGRIVLFGGYTNSQIGDTWEWTGNDWQAMAPVASPSPRWGPSLADTGTGVLLFGGFDGAAESDQTWLWNGTDWRRLSLTTQPSPRLYAGIAFDAARRRVVLHGGLAVNGNPWDPQSFLADTWEWDGSAWSQRAPTRSPSARGLHAMCYDSARGRSVLFGGYDGVTARADVWEWNGASWSERYGGSPAGRLGVAMAYDPHRDRLVLFGGEITGQFGRPWPSYHADTWEWDGAAWIRRNPANSPPIRGFHRMAYDSARRRVVLFGGWDGSTSLADTWTWDGTDWTQENPAQSPSARHSPTMVYDPRRQHVLLFGGGVGSTPAHLGDTWIWNGTDWIQQNPGTQPGVRRHHKMAYDTRRDRMVLFGGYNGGAIADTWLWGGADWTRRTPSVQPGPRWGHAMVYDTEQRVAVLFGGFDGFTRFDDTWEWDGTDWRKCAQVGRPLARYYHGMAYDSTRGRTLLFGGLGSLGDMWQYRNPNPASVTSFGAGCPSSSGTTPVVDARGESLPWIGESFDIELSSMPTGPSDVPFLFIGLSNSSWGAFQLPLNLAFLGLDPRCFLRVSPDATVSLVNNGGRAVLPLPIPAQRTIVGLEFHLQCGVGELLRNPVHISMSNAATARIGARTCR